MVQENKQLTDRLIQAIETQQAFRQWEASNTPREPRVLYGDLILFGPITRLGGLLGAADPLIVRPGY